MNAEFLFSATASDPTTRLRKLDALLELRGPELHALYVAAKTPRLADVRGDLRGRMLAWPVARDGAVATVLQAVAGASGFPWRGKTFMPRGESAGEGINRVFSDKFRLFRFETHVGKSKAGDFEAVQLDYDLPENPFAIRRIEDEIRELEPGLWLGQAWLRVGKSARLWLYFGLARKDAS